MVNYGFVYFSNMFHNKEDALFRQSLSKQLDDQISKLNAGKVIGGAIGKAILILTGLFMTRRIS